MSNQACEPTLGDLEDQTPVYDSDLEQEKLAILGELDDCKFMRRVIKLRENELRFALARVMKQLSPLPELKEFDNPVHVVVLEPDLSDPSDPFVWNAGLTTVVMEKRFNGTTQPISPDASPDDNL